MYPKRNRLQNRKWRPYWFCCHMKSHCFPRRLRQQRETEILVHPNVCMCVSAVSVTERYRYKTIDCVFNDPHEKKNTTYLNASIRTVNRCTSLFLYTEWLLLFFILREQFFVLSLFGLRKIWIFVHIKVLIRLFRFLLSFRSLLIGRDKSIRTKMPIYVSRLAARCIDATTDFYRALKNDKFRIRIAAYACECKKLRSCPRNLHAHIHAEANVLHTHGSGTREGFSIKVMQNTKQE